ncbi:MAG: DUF4097 family beta strand repeat-containing protein [Bacteroidota bacterium]|uniref:DUF4097 domain-containing protein n=1 Tax=Roseivirga thermotolerans TaxID=1758176 RepID=A0ABQ3I4P1_9BACT|nr:MULTISPECIES: DUF4097 family beta strand repeat-containing protein [Roseivirga]MEC7753987.1 DUF4097 family beta strand repeat-containing protein [Bacteroidota bacterium]GHE61475.1 hypothetical protein GCM10011340_15560 [Roseivirga thermotolerans]|tara:strand:- start:8789 stop:9754 length:966 start_codon:yes stop_codon:yes gene_type:complete
MQQLKSILTLLALTFTITFTQAQERIEKTFTGIKSIRLTTASGNGTIKKGSGNQVKVTVEYTYDKEDYEPEFEQNGDRLTIKEEFRRSRWTRGYSEWTLEIPDGLELDFKTGSGNIEVNGLTVELRTNTGSGNIRLDDVRGDVHANTGSGNISLRAVDGAMDVNTGSGSIRIDRAKGNTDLNTGSGNVRANGIEGGLRINTGSGNIEVDEAKIRGNSSLNTGSGNVEVTLAGELDYDLSLNTGSGNAMLNFNGHEIAGEFYMRANDEDDISAPFRFDRSYEDDRGSNWRGRNKGHIKEAKIGNKTIRIRISTGSGRAVVRK